MKTDIRTMVTTIMSHRGINQTELATLLGVSQPSVTRWLSGSQPRGLTLDQIKDLYREVTSAGPGSSIVPLMGYVGAGAEIEPDFEQTPDAGLEPVEIPLELPDGLICFRVRGSSMMPQFSDGQTIVVWRQQRRPLSYFYGREAIVRTEDGRRFVKTIMRSGDGEKTVNLLSWNASPIEHVRLAWIGEIFMVLPAGFSATF